MPDEKLREAILYICHYSEGDSRLGAVKLNKLLWFADVEAMHRFGKTITETEYQRLPEGPAPRRMPPVMTELLRMGAIEQHREQVFGKHLICRHIAKMCPKNGTLAAKEEVILKEVLAKYKDVNGTAMSRLSHKGIGWRVSKNGETIPVETEFVKPRPLTYGEKVFARSLTNIPTYAR